MISKLDMLFSTNFGVIVILFLLPFVTVSCGGQVVNIPLTGLDLALGKNIEMKSPSLVDHDHPSEFNSSQLSRSNDTHRLDLPPSPFAAISLGLAVFGMVIGFMNYLPARILAALSGLTGGVLLLVLKIKMDEEALKEGAGLFLLSYGFPFWFSLLLFLGTAGGCAYSAWQIYQRWYCYRE